MDMIMEMMERTDLSSLTKFDFIVVDKRALD